MQVSYWLGEIGKPWYKMSHHLGTKYPGVLGGQDISSIGDRMSHHLGG